MSNSKKKTLYAFLILLCSLIFRSHGGLLINALKCGTHETTVTLTFDLISSSLSQSGELSKVRRKSLKAILKYLFTFFTRMAVCTYTRWTEDPKPTSSLWPWLSPAWMYTLITIKLRIHSL